LEEGRPAILPINQSWNWGTNSAGIAPTNAGQLGEILVPIEHSPAVSLARTSNSYMPN
jgi:hypothetical protein